MAGRITRDKVSDAYEEQLRSDPCSYCGQPEAGEVDHIQATREGGKDTWENMTAACRSCNGSKGARTLLLYLVERTGPTVRRQSRRRDSGALKQIQLQAKEGEVLEANIVRLQAWMWEVLRERKAETGESLSLQIAQLLEAAFRLERGERS